MHINEDKIIEWAIKYQQGRMSDEDKNAFEKWLDEHPEHLVLVNKYRQLYFSGRSLGLAASIKKEKAWQAISESIQQPKRKILPDWVYYAAAVLILGLLSAWFIVNEISKIEPAYHYNFEQLAEVGSRKASLKMANGMLVDLEKGGKQGYAEKDGTTILKDTNNNLVYQPKSIGAEELIFNEINVPRAGEYSLTLSDGTQVWLNADTRFRYPVQFRSDKREVHLLSGEACFKVAHNKEAPFSVNAKDTKVVALGTMFNVSSYDNQEFIATTLVEGSVQVDYLAEQTILQPGEQSIITRGKDGIVVQEVDANVFVAWVHGVFEFENTDLKYLSEQLERWYNVNFFFTAQEIKDIRFTGAFKRDQSINYAIDLIEQITDVKFKVEGENIIIEK